MMRHIIKNDVTHSKMINRVGDTLTKMIRHIKNDKTHKQK